MKTYGIFLKAFSIPFSVIVLMLFDKYIYDIPTLVAALSVACLVFISYQIIDRISLSKKELNKNMNLVLNLVVLASIFGVFYLFDL